ncbi:hypothetical protein ZOD2009_14281 [Haladaptatus paucihalophilus DX253]|uniref:Arylsulfotransferase (ASST) n=1 Tax=Haladaptatus paucihalophilus DX253 TaxID=797209 RepID=E7QVM0_HALPU|nr:aryl-sulfate sulfotransferase [Haladaptatus paucihalophilus]EFW91283.1 hypothetical protein ZOD2009_14281 [Haladaptatus paucihalophilus DX253]SHL09627.1 Arylsulfotransferase (ASST) [Haladaptatus paucihalophilus DX253]
MDGRKSDTNEESAGYRSYVPSKRVIRIAFVLVLLVLSAPIASAYLQSGTEWSSARMENRTVPPANGVTVVTSDAYGGGRIGAYGPSGKTLYYNDSHDFYHDVDPSAKGENTVLYVASDDVSKSECDSSVKCRRSVVERLNLTTGKITRIWSDVRPSRGSSAIHDVDYLGNGKLLVAEINPPDGVYIVDTNTDNIEWYWRAEQNFSHASGGNFPRDWTHINNVQQLHDGRIAVSVRNQDQVIFLNRSTGMKSNWTLGADDRHETLFEQHNPDYINESNGGPALLVADSENNRAVEYQRSNGSWNRTWAWSDSKMQWPRDADRLPNGHTLITDSNGDRVLEVNKQNEIVWSMSFPGPYEAERLGTGDESTNGTSAKALGLEPHTAGSTTDGTSYVVAAMAEQAVHTGINLLPPRILHALLFVFPVWITPVSAIAALALAGVVVLWLLFELHWASYTLSFSLPVRLSRESSDTDSSDGNAER